MRKIKRRAKQRRKRRNPNNFGKKKKIQLPSYAKLVEPAGNLIAPFPQITADIYEDDNYLYFCKPKTKVVIKRVNRTKLRRSKLMRQLRKHRRNPIKHRRKIQRRGKVKQCRGKKIRGGRCGRRIFGKKYCWQH